MTHVAHDGRAIPPDGVVHGHVELTRPLTRATELADKSAGGVKHQDAQFGEHPSGAVEYIQVALFVEGDVAHMAEHLPRLSVDHADPINLVKVRVDPLIPARDFDDLLSEESRGRGKDGQEKDRRDGDEPAGLHRDFSGESDVEVATTNSRYRRLDALSWR